MALACLCGKYRQYWGRTYRDEGADDDGDGDREKATGVAMEMGDGDGKGDGDGDGDGNGDDDGGLRWLKTSEAEGQ